IIALSAVLAVTSAGLLPAAHYSSAAAVSSQSIVRHDQGHGIAAAPIAYNAAPLAYSAPVAYASP
ncbi:jg22963, partial [Pararge aegeria aegeria]